MSTLALVKAFADNLVMAFQSTGGGPEERLKTPVAALIHDFGAQLGLQAAAGNEYKLDSLGIGGLRPDIGVEVDKLTMGFVKLKARGKGAQPDKLKSPHDKEQWQKLKDLPNVIYSDGEEWALYKTGQRKLLFRIDPAIFTEGSIAVTPAVSTQFDQLLLAFYETDAIVAETPEQLAEQLGPLCRVLRDSVLAAMQTADSPLARQAQQWRSLLFQDANDSGFADAYAQTVTYGMLLARMSGDAGKIDRHSAATRLEDGHGLFAHVLRTLTDEEIEGAIDVPLALLERAINAVKPDRINRRAGKRDPWIYFYEHFLGAYDPQLRKDRGVYYTPIEVVDAQVRLVDELLHTELGKTAGFLDESVVVLDPAVGTGTYLLALVDHVLKPIADKWGDATSAPATDLAKRIFGFEIMVGPYAVAHMRVTQSITHSYGGVLPKDGANILLGDTLASPYLPAQPSLGLFYARMAKEHERVQGVKRDTKVMVCLGNPPYGRQQRDEAAVEAGVRKKGGWVRGTDEGGSEDHALLQDFLRPAREAGKGGHLKNLYNDYVYFWRWAMWKVLENTDGPGIVAFITAASFLRGPSFVGMREHMRKVFDEIWIIDLQGDNHGARKTENVFAIQTPVCITIGIRRGAPQPTVPATVWYKVVEGKAAQKLAWLEAVKSRGDVNWQKCMDGWQEPMLSAGVGIYFGWPLLADIFPWQQSGTMAGRTWVFDAHSKPLIRRWQKLLAGTGGARRTWFKESPTGRHIGDTPAQLPPAMDRLPSLATITDGPLPATERFGWRSFDRQWCLADGRLWDRPGPAVWFVRSPQQVYLTSLITKVLGLGPAATVSAFVPDKDYFCGRGAKDVIPLWRDAAATQANVTAGVLAFLTATLGHPVTAPDLFAYTYALLANPSYVDRFSEELTVPGGPTLPITKDPDLFARGASLGRDLLCWHTYGERFAPNGFQLSGKARWLQGIPPTGDAYPERFTPPDAIVQQLLLGEGVVGPVAPEVWNFSVSGLQVVRSWLNYRMKGGAGRTSSPLDGIRETVWPRAFNEELLELLWVLEHTVAQRPALDALLADVLAGPMFLASELPQPTDAEHEAPKVGGRQKVLRCTPLDTDRCTEDAYTSDWLFK